MENLQGKFPKFVLEVFSNVNVLGRTGKMLHLISFGLGIKRWRETLFILRAYVCGDKRNGYGSKVGQSVSPL